jgi:cyanophycinase
MLHSHSCSRIGRRRWLAAAALTLAALLSPALHAEEDLQGIAVPIGGALKFDNDAVWQRLVDLAGGKGARFVVFPTASSDPEKSGAGIVEALQRHGAEAEVIAVAPKIKGLDIEKAVRDPKWIDKVRSARGAYFAGGAQERIVDTLMPGGKRTPLLDAVWELFHGGGVVAGSSAGAAIMSTVMFRDAQDVVQTMKGPLREGREIDRGLGFVGPDLFVDQHFLKRGRLGRMLAVMQARHYRWGLGVDENSAAVVRGRHIEVIGAKGAIVVDLREAKSDVSLGAFNLRQARVSYLERGDRFDIDAGTLTPSPQKQAGARIDPNAAGFKPYYDDNPFWMDMAGDTVASNAMAHLLDSRQSEARGLAFNAHPPPGDAAPQLGFEFRFYKDAQTLGWYTGAFGGEDYTVANLRLDVTPVRVAQPLYLPLHP